MARFVSIKKLTVAAVGELLWDQVNDEEYLGGAPFIFAYYCHALGAKAHVLSRVGTDERGQRAIERIHELGMPVGLIERDDVRATGTASVELDANGEPNYIFPPDSAWEAFEYLSEDRTIIDESDILYFGTLSQRNPRSRAALLAAVAATRPNMEVVYDVNLRRPEPEAHVVRSGLEAATIVKMNEAEWLWTSKHLGLPESLPEALAALFRETRLRTVLVTRGCQGATAYTRGGTIEQVPGHPVEVVDTVGAGDAFLAVFATQIAAGNTLHSSLETANLAGAFVASQRGGTPPVTKDLLGQYEFDHHLEHAKVVL